MKILESKIFDFINFCLSAIQSKTDKIRQNSFLLSSIDYLILFVILLTYIISTVANTETLGIIAILAPLLVFFKVLITQGEKIELEKCNFFLLIYLLICLISNFTSSMLPQSLYGFMKTVIYISFYFALCQFLKQGKKFIPIILLTIAIITGIESVIGLVQNYIGVENISTWQDISYVNPEDVLSRVYGTLKPYNPNLFGGFLIASFPAVIAMLGISIKNKKTVNTIIWSICSLLTAYVIFLTGCRGAYLALFTMILGIGIITFGKIKKYTPLVITAAAAFIFLNHGILKRLLSIFIMRGDTSTSFRLNVYHSSWQMFLDNPICGIGVGNKVFREIYGLYMLSGFDALSCYCVFLELAVESGIFALISYIAFIGSLIYDGIKKLYSGIYGNEKIIIFSALIGIIAVMVHGLFDTVYFRPQIQFIFWSLCAILMVYLREEKTE